MNLRWVSAECCLLYISWICAENEGGLLAGNIFGTGIFARAAHGGGGWSDKHLHFVRAILSCTRFLLNRFEAYSLMYQISSGYSLVGNRDPQTYCSYQCKWSGMTTEWFFGCLVTTNSVSKKCFAPPLSRLLDRARVLQVMNFHILDKFRMILW